MGRSTADAFVCRAGCGAPGCAADRADAKGVTMFLPHFPVPSRVRPTTSTSPAHWLERLQRLKHDPRLVAHLGPMLSADRPHCTTPPDQWLEGVEHLRQDPRLLARFRAFYGHLAALPRRARRWLARKA